MSVLMRRISSLLVAGLALAALSASPAPAASSGPGYLIESMANPTVFPAACTSGCRYTVTVVNSGSAATDGTPVTIRDTLPAGMTAQSVSGEVPAQESAERKGPPILLHCGLEGGSPYCTYSSGVLPVGELLVVELYATVQPGVSGVVTNAVQVSGGGASPAAASFQNTVGGAAPAPGLSGFSFTLTGPEGGLDTQAGDHPNSTIANFQFVNKWNGPESESNRGESTYSSVQAAKDVVVDLPPGFIGNTQAVTKCDIRQLEPLDSSARGPECPPGSAVGTVSLNSFGEQYFGDHNVALDLSNPVVYNMEPERGYPAEFGFNVSGHAVLLYATAVPSSDGYVLQVSSRGIVEAFNFDAFSFTFWGVPGEASHDRWRGGVSSGLAATGFLGNPVDCSGGPLVATAMSDTWQDPGRWTASGEPDLSDPAWRVMTSTVYPSITGCDLLQFDPALEVTPEVTQVDEPTGLGVTIRVPQAPLLPPNLLTPEFKDVTVTLPSGVSLSPSTADGLQACSAEEIQMQSRLAGSCPDASVLGTVRATTPLLASPLEGRVFLAAPGCDPCSNADAADGNMYGIYLELAGEGVVVKQRGTIYANTATGQLTSTFQNAPELPVSELLVHFKGGLRAALATPQSCGQYVTTSDITPWSTPITPDAAPSSVFDASWDGDGGACPGVLPFAPVLSAGTSNPNAGQESPLTFTFARQDREQDIAGIQVTTPVGLLGSLSGIPLCGEPAADLGTCPQASRIGSVTVAAGAGGHPFYAQGTVYLTGPYKGAPFGLSIVVPTVAGPFNLGNVVVRAKIDVDPQTAALTVTTDALPQIIDGVPLRLRSANVTIDRPHFIVNPTSCAQLSIAATLSGAQGAVSHTSVPFAVAGCAGLRFAPKFTATTTAHPSRVDGTSLDVRLAVPLGANSNLERVGVELPKQLPARLTTLQHACPASVFEGNPAACPVGSRVGYARASTPILPVPLIGPAYFVSHGGAAFPNLVFVLQGYGVRVDVVGSTFISKQGITSSTFSGIPDVPVSTFELYLPQGPGSALTALGNPCAHRLLMPTTLAAQDGAQVKQNTAVKVTGCTTRKAKATRKAKKSSAHTSRHRAKGGSGRSKQERTHR